MPVLDTSFVGELLNCIGPLAVHLGVALSVAEACYQWFIRIAFAKQLTKFN